MKNPFEKKFEDYLDRNKKFDDSLDNREIGFDSKDLSPKFNKNPVYKNLSPQKILQKYVEFNNFEPINEKIEKMLVWKTELEENLEQASYFDPTIGDKIIESLQKDIESYEKESSMWKNVYEELKEKQAQKYAFEESELTHKELKRVTKELSLLYKKYEIFSEKETSQKGYLN